MNERGENLRRVFPSLFVAGRMQFMLKAILFDAYGTLISTGDGSVRAAGEILALNRRTDIEPTAFYGRWKKLHRQHIDSRAAFLTEEEVFLLDLCQLYREYGLTRDACQDVKVMLDTLGHRTAFPEAGAVLRELGKDYIVAIGSTTDTAPLLMDLERTGGSLYLHL
jgi:FMN phosphatase YigB (HAD superfamily)